MLKKAVFLIVLLFSVPAFSQTPVGSVVSHDATIQVSSNELLLTLNKQIEEINALKQTVVDQQNTTAGATIDPTPTPDMQAWWMNLILMIISFIASIAVPVISYLIIVLLRRWNVKIEQDKIDWILQKTVGYAEQKAKVALKDGKPMSGPEVLKVALDQGNKFLTKYALDKKFSSWLTDLIEAKLGEKTRETTPSKG